APPAPADSSPSIANGSTLFSRIGCALCHTPSLTTGVSSTAALSGKQANLFSDLLVHHMGSGLADDIVQGAAGPDEFRTAPLWGLGQRLFFLHDGRTVDLLQAIQAHSSSGSEANQVIDYFNGVLFRSGKLRDEFLNAVQAGFGCAVIEDGEEILAALDCGEISPGLLGAGMASESRTDHRRQVVFRVHRRHEILSDAFGAFLARFRRLRICNLVYKPFANRIAQAVKPIAKRAFLVHGRIQFLWELDHSRGKIRGQRKDRRAARSDARSLLHFFVD